MNSPKILVFAGSTRVGSYNKALAKIAAQAATAAGAAVTLLDLRDLTLPLYDADLENTYGLPEGVHKFKNLLREADGIIVASPEYNGSITGVLKNALDWASRAAANEAPGSVFQGKLATLVSASPGPLGGLRGLVHLRAILANLGMIVLPEQLAIGSAHEAIDPAGTLKDARKAGQLVALVTELVRVAAKLKA